MKSLLTLALVVVGAVQLPASAQLPVPRTAVDAKSSDGAQAQSAPPQGLPHFRFENFTTANGLPDNHVYTVLVDGDRIWAGTENGLALYENHKWKTYTIADGLAHRAVLSLALDKRTGDVWAGTMGGLSRISAGHITSFTQLNSGLSNDVVYGVSVDGENVWVGTAAGACRLDLRTNQWSLYNERNTPMAEIWVYGVHATPTKVYFAVWGSGILEYDQKTGRWDKYDDPDGETEMVLFKDQGLIFGPPPTLAIAATTAVTGTTFLPRTAGCPPTSPTPSRVSTPIARGSEPTRDWLTTTASTGLSIAPPSLLESPK